MNLKAKLAELLKQDNEARGVNFQFFWNANAKTWCFSGTGYGGNGHETEDFDADTKQEAIQDAIDYLETQIEENEDY